VAACFPLLYALAPATLFSQEPKYLVVLSPVLVLLVAQLASTYWRAVALVGVALAVSTGTLHKMDTYFRTVPVQPPVAPRDLGPLISTLDDLGVDRVYADFWLAYRLTFDTDERIIAALAFGLGGFEQFDAFERIPTGHILNVFQRQINERQSLFGYPISVQPNFPEKYKHLFVWRHIHSLWLVRLLYQIQFSRQW
jgi:hypothetical protein